jgi:hypothetical protein
MDELSQMHNADDSRKNKTKQMQSMLDPSNTKRIE